MKYILLSSLSLFTGCAEMHARQQRFADAYFGEPGHSFGEAFAGTMVGAVGAAATGYANGYAAWAATQPCQVVVPEQHGIIVGSVGQRSVFLNY